MKTPTIHLNGTSKDALLEALNTAQVAVLDAMHATNACAPNARDYYPQGSGAYLAANREHAARLARLASVREELLVLAARIDDGTTDDDDPNILRCAECGCSEIQATAWVYVNGRQIAVGDGPTDQIWCPHCERDVAIAGE